MPDDQLSEEDEKAEAEELRLIEKLNNPITERLRQEFVRILDEEKKGDGSN